VSKDPAKLEEIAQQYLDYIRPTMVMPTTHQDYVINMDETAVPFDMTSDITLETKGAKTVTIRSTGSEKKRATVSIAITASGRVLEPMIIFKGEKSGRIATKELPHFQQCAKYTCQKNAWMDEPNFVEWIDKILVPYIATTPEGIVPVLVLDQNSTHRKKTIIAKLHELGIQVEFLPPSTTAVLQPVDVGINRTFKRIIRKQWNEWLDQTKFKKQPTRKNIADWTIYAMSKLNTTLVRNAWRHSTYYWFNPDDLFDNL